MSFKVKSIKNLPPVSRGEKRAWYQCTSCGRFYYRDYLPYSLSTPVFTLSCGHDFRRAAVAVTAEEGMTGLYKQQMKLPETPRIDLG